MSERKVGPVAQFLLEGRKFFEDETRYIAGQFIGCGPGLLGVFRPRYCAVGYLHMHKVWSVGTVTRVDAEDFLIEASFELYNEHNVMVINDSLGREAVVNVFKRAAQKALNAQA